RVLGISAADGEAQDRAFREHVEAAEPHAAGPERLLAESFESLGALLCLFLLLVRVRLVERLLPVGLDPRPAGELERDGFREGRELVEALADDQIARRPRRFLGELRLLFLHGLDLRGREEGAWAR